MSYVAPLVKSLCTLAKRFGLRVEFTTKAMPDYQYTPGVLRCESASTGASNLAHELAHWLLASRKRRGSIDFGLGFGPDSRLSSKLEIEEARCYKEERAASVLGMYLEYFVEHDPSWTLKHHDWDSPRDRLFVQTQRRLYQQKWLTRASGDAGFLGYRINLRTLKQHEKRSQ